MMHGARHLQQQYRQQHFHLAPTSCRQQESRSSTTLRITSNVSACTASYSRVHRAWKQQPARNSANKQLQPSQHLITCAQRPLSRHISAIPTNISLSSHNSLEGPQDDLQCNHFGPCAGCTLQQGLWQPPVAEKAREFFKSRGCEIFKLQTGPVHEWRCRAKLAVRGTADAPVVGLFQTGSHLVTPIPDCRAHHPRINAAVKLLQQVVAGLRIQPYAEQHHGKHGRGKQQGRSSGGFLRYVQLTVLPREAGGRAEEDEEAQVQLVLVWAAPDAAHASFKDAQRLGAALWAQAGTKPTSPLAALRARAEAATAAAAAAGSSGRSSTHPGRAGAVASSSRLAGRGQAARGSTAPPASPLLHSIWVNFQPHSDSNKVLGDTWQLLHGAGTGWQEFGGVDLAVGPGSFVQANYGAMQRCLASVAAAVPQGSSVLELYAGSGVIGLSLAASGCVQQVICVEINPLATLCFEASWHRLAATNKVAASKIRHVTASAGDQEALRQVLSRHSPRPGDSQPATSPQEAAAVGAAGNFESPQQAGVTSPQPLSVDVLIVDPPKKGLDPFLLQWLTEDASSTHAGSSTHVSTKATEVVGDATTHADAARVEAMNKGTSLLVQHISSTSSGVSMLSGIRRLVYLSCGFSALRSDADVLLSAGWRVLSAEAFLFFPGTDSIETLVVFERQ